MVVENKTIRLSSTVIHSVAGSGVSDQPAQEDQLGFEPYVTALAEFLSHQDTAPPLTVSIEGEWGSGKTSFMQQLEKELETRGSISVWFNPWRYDKSDSLWAAFALTFLKTLKRKAVEREGKRSLRQSLFSFLKLNWRRIDWNRGWADIAKFVWLVTVAVAIVIAVPVLAYTGGIETLFKLLDLFFTEDWSNTALRGATGFGASISYLAIALLTLRRLRRYLGAPFEVDLNRHFKNPDYESKISFIEQFHSDFFNVVQAYAQQRRVYVFIDDLDRCDVPRSAELMQALNLMISGNTQAESLNLVFIIGMDREKVAAGLAVKHEKLLKYLDDNVDSVRKGQEYGHSYIEKFVQIPFTIPRPEEAELKKFLRTLAAESSARHTMLSDVPTEPKTQTEAATSHVPGPSHDAQKNQQQQRAQQRAHLQIALRGDSATVQSIVLLVAPALDYNPRRIKQFINLFRLRAYIASETGLFIEEEGSEDDRSLTLPQLGKFVALSLRWPDLIGALESNRNLLASIQEYALVGDDRQLTDAARYWCRNDRMIRLLRAGHKKRESDDRFLEDLTYSMRNLDLDRLLKVSPRVTKSQHSKSKKGQHGVEQTKQVEARSEKGYIPPTTADELIARRERGDKYFSGVELGQAKLNGANLVHVNLESSNLSQAEFNGADLRYAVLGGADLVETAFNGANLSSANLDGADLSGADLSRANLNQARLVSAILEQTNLAGADLRGTDLSEVDLSSATLEQALYNPDTQFPSGFFPERSGMIQG